MKPLSRDRRAYNNLKQLGYHHELVSCADSWWAVYFPEPDFEGPPAEPDEGPTEEGGVVEDRELSQSIVSVDVQMLHEYVLRYWSMRLSMCSSTVAFH